ncbi:glycosyltransferase [Rhodopseudomonas palustris]|uniref:Glycosyltransferase n=1 Tax=Rhodopseudomonas palustris TaxID=1076 RepID=A0A418VFB8_RHOPL|nr:glycosyltransferase [Rhodopseudomonas palustris]RJF74815.1 glycosyltransferase [Rhodopseudomonas palustris]
MVDRDRPEDDQVADGAAARWVERPRFLRYWMPAPPTVGKSEHQRGDCGRRIDDDAAPELACLRGVLAAGLLNAAARRAEDLGISAERVLIQWGVIDEDAYLSRLAGHLGIPLIDLTLIPRADCPLPDHQIAAAARAGVIPLRQHGELSHVVAPTVRFPARALCRRRAKWPTAPLRLTSAAALQHFLEQHGRVAIGRSAAFGLRRRWPMLSASTGERSATLWRQRLLRCALVTGGLAGVPWFAPAATATLLALWFIGFAGLRLIAGLWPIRPPRRRLRRLDETLPVYTLVAALYREAGTVADLVAALEALDYPHEKLDIILVLEPNDLATRAALARLKPRPHLRVLIAPPFGPQTKPKALNYALAFARGEILAVYDAEDRPEPGQLRAALDAFDQHGPATGCVQASLSIDNLTHSWLSRTFLAEYAGQFDLVLRGMTALRMPLPLGGTSNHFRVSVLRAVGGWDPFNVTEDADLGFRLARFGYGAAAFASTTFEEAPITLRNWLPQRTRWMKGFIQTWLVHMRHPLRLWREIGGRGIATLNLLVAGNVVTALAYPVLLGIVAIAAAGQVVPLPDWLQPERPAALHHLAFLTGYVATIVVGLAGLARRRRLRLAPVLLLTPLYWLCLSAAAWRAVWQFVWSPHYWEKTTHGVARRAQSPGSRQASATDSASDRRRPRRTSV